MYYLYYLELDLIFVITDIFKKRYVDSDSLKHDEPCEKFVYSAQNCTFTKLYISLCKQVMNIVT